MVYTCMYEATYSQYNRQHRPNVITHKSMIAMMHWQLDAHIKHPHKF